MLYCAHSQQNQLFELLDVQNPQMSFGNLQGLAKMFLHVQNPEMSFGNLQTQTNRFFEMVLFYGPKAPGAHRAHGPRPLGPIGPMRSHAVRGLGPWVLWAPGALGPTPF